MAALNINFQGNIFGATGDRISASYQVYSHSIGKWSEVRQSDQQQYNFNFGDGDLNTQDGTVLLGDKITVAFWEVGKNRDEELALFSAITFVYEGEFSTVQDVQLLPDPPIVCGWDAPLTTLINTDFTVTLEPSLHREWEFDGGTMVQDRIIEDTVIFPFLTVTLEQVDFEDGFANDLTHSYSTMGERTVTARFASAYGKEAQCEKTIFAVYPPPTGEISITNEPLKTFDTAIIETLIQDPNSTVESIEYFVDETFIEDGTALANTYECKVMGIGTYTAHYLITWDNGQTASTLDVSTMFEVENTPPTIQLFHQVSPTMDYTHNFSALVGDLEDASSSLPVKWEIYYLSTSTSFPTPFFGTCEESALGQEYYLIYASDSIGRDISIPFSQIGLYRIVATTVDSGGLSAEASIELSVTEVCSIENTCPDEYKTLEEFEIAIQQAREEEGIKYRKIIDTLRIEVERRTPPPIGLPDAIIPSTLIPNARDSSLLNTSSNGSLQHPYQSSFDGYDNALAIEDDRTIV